MNLDIGLKRISLDLLGEGAHVVCKLTLRAALSRQSFGSLEHDIQNEWLAESFTVAKQLLYSLCN